MRFTLTALVFTVIFSAANATTFDAQFFETHTMKPIGGVDLGTVDNEIKSVAWFANPERTVKYCLKHSADFPFTETETRNVVKKAFTKWRNYLRKLKSSAYAAIAHQAEESDCNSADLKFYFGFEDQDVRDDLKKLNSPLAYASRLTEMDQPWAEGYIWFDKKRFSKMAEGKNRWPALVKLEVLAMHELGHTFGFGHVPGTVMDAKGIYENFQSPKITSFLAIERDRLLSFSQQLRLHGKSEESIAQKLTGRNISNDLKVKLRGDMNSPVLIFESGGFETRKKIKLNGNSGKEFSYHRSQNNSFAVGNGGPIVEIKDGVSVHYGTVKDAAGKDHMIIAEYNMNREDFNVGPVVLRMQDGQESKVLFQSFFSNVSCKEPTPGAVEACP